MAYITAEEERGRCCDMTVFCSSDMAFMFLPCINSKNLSVSSSAAAAIFFVCLRWCGKSEIVPFPHVIIYSISVSLPFTFSQRGNFSTLFSSVQTCDTISGFPSSCFSAQIQKKANNSLEETLLYIKLRV